MGAARARAAADGIGGAQKLRVEDPREIDRVALIVAVRDDAAHLVGERTHGAKRGVERRIRKRPRVPERHRAKAPRFLAAARADANVDVQQRDVGNRAAAELIRRAILEVLEGVTDFDDADVGGRWREHGRRERSQGCRLDHVAAGESLRGTRGL